MIKVTKLNNIEYILNSDLIETIEATPDTIITTTNGKKLIVKETVGEVVGRVADFRSRIFCQAMPSGCEPAREVR